MTNTERFQLAKDGKNWVISDTETDWRFTHTSRRGFPASSLEFRARLALKNLNENARKAETDPKLYWLDGQWRRDWS